MQDLSNRGAAGGLYSVVAVGLRPDANKFASAGVDPSDVPASLLAALDGSVGPLYAYSTVRPDGGERVDVLVVGSRLRTPDGASTTGSSTCSRCRPSRRRSRSCSARSPAAGILLVGLLALIAGLVARQVVTPVREAAESAEQLAAGRLEQRLQVRGEDEIARLGATFNTMAEALQRQIRQLEDLSHVQQRFVSDVTPRAADAADDRADGRRRAARGPRRVRPRHPPQRRAAAGRARPVRGAARGAARDQPVRRRRRPARGRADRPGGPGRPRARADRAARGAPREPGAAARARRPAWSPSSTTSASSGCCATSSSTPSSTARAARSRCSSPATTASVAVLVRDRGRGAARRAGRAGVHAVLARRPVAGAHDRRDRPRARHRAGGRAPARRAPRGVGPGRPRARRSGSPCPARAGDALDEASPLPLGPPPPGSEP